MNWFHWLSSSFNRMSLHDFDIPDEPSWSPTLNRPVASGGEAHATGPQLARIRDELMDLRDVVLTFTDEMVERIDRIDPTALGMTAAATNVTSLDSHRK